jgi:hypothetical protein
MKAQIQQILIQNTSKDNHPVLASATVKQQLLPIINHLMDTNFGRFVQTLYELDIDEKKIMDITTTGAMDAGQVADLILEREQKKIETRRLFHRDYNGDEGLLL